MTREIYFEDLTVGQMFRSISVEMTTEKIIAFARENDPQYFHVDADAAKDSLFGGLVASGWQTAALSLRLLLNESGVRFVGGVVGADALVAWKRPVRAGDCLRMECEITKLAASRSKPEVGFVSFNGAMLDQNNKPVQTLKATMLVHRRPSLTGP